MTRPRRWFAVMEVTANAVQSPGAFYACANEFAGYAMLRGGDILR